MDATTYTTWQLARLADVTDPDAHDGMGFSADQGTTPVEGSPGAKFLRSVAYDVANLLDEADEDTPSEIADSAVPIYTHEMWSTFVDLAAYTEDISELGAEDAEMDKQAATALYMIAERLASALIEAETDDD
jgi:hypothetical protein